MRIFKGFEKIWAENTYFECEWKEIKFFVLVFWTLRDELRGLRNLMIQSHQLSQLILYTSSVSSKFRICDKINGFWILWFRRKNYSVFMQKMKEGVLKIKFRNFQDISDSSWKFRISSCILWLFEDKQISKFFFSQKFDQAFLTSPDTLQVSNRFWFCSRRISQKMLNCFFSKLRFWSPKKSRFLIYWGLFQEKKKVISKDERGASVKFQKVGNFWRFFRKFGDLDLDRSQFRYVMHVMSEEFPSRFKMRTQLKIINLFSHFFVL